LVVAEADFQRLLYGEVVGGVFHALRCYSPHGYLYDALAHQRTRFCISYLGIDHGEGGAVKFA
jgi:hypothetical protein